MRTFLRALMPIVASGYSHTLLAQPASSDEINQLRKQIEALTSKVTDLQQQVNQQRMAPLFSFGGEAEGGKRMAPTESSSSYTPPKETNLSAFNPEISAAIDFVGSYSNRGDNVNFIVRDAEIMLQANVDHLARAYVVFNAETELTPTEKTDPFEESSLGIEEAAIETTGLPYGLQLKAGQFFADFTRLGKVHSHELPFTDRPLSLDRIIGGEDRARGLEASWVPPIGHYVRITGGLTDGLGAETAITNELRQLDGEVTDLFDRTRHRGGGDRMAYARVATIFEPSSEVTLNVGGDFARGRDQGERQIASGDFKLSWVPRADGYDLFEAGGEYLWSRSQGNFAGDGRELQGGGTGTASARGGYVYAQYRVGKSWQPGVRFDYLKSDGFQELDLDGDGAPDRIGDFDSSTRTYSAYLSYYFSEFNRVRLELSYVDSDQEVVAGAKQDWQAFFQWTVTLGPHKHPFTP